MIELAAMDDLERISHGGYGGAPVAAPGLFRYTAKQVLHRHRHDTAYAALVLSGSYVEAGDTGRHRVTQGDVIIHQSYESHLNRFPPHGAEVLVLPLRGSWRAPVIGRCNNLDFIVRLAERSPASAVNALKDRLKARQSTCEDWPDILAADLIADPALCIAHWARCNEMHPGSVSRGFSQQFGLTPAEFRYAARAHRAARAVAGGQTPLAEIALAAGFADQAHMCHAVRRLTGLSPTMLRRRTQASAQHIEREAHLNALAIPGKRSSED
jgi:AraC-like DNA-binding protein